MNDAWNMHLLIGFSGDFDTSRDAFLWLLLITFVDASLLLAVGSLALRSFFCDELFLLLEAAVVFAVRGDARG